jgi:AraC-like DNA-binding protein
MNDIIKLLEILHRMVPISYAFRKLLTPLLRKKNLNDYRILLRPNAKAKKAWFLIRGFVIAKGYDLNNNMIVFSIYFPGQIVTDLDSFFEGILIKYKYIAIRKAKVLELTKKKYEKLKEQEETNKLAQHIMLLEKEQQSAKTELLILPEAERIKIFLSSFPVHDLPDKYSAAFLRLPLSLFKAEKMKYLLEGNLLFRPDGIAAAPAKTTLQQVYEINAYIHEHFKLKDIEDEVIQMMGNNTTIKTIERNFSKTFGLTTRKLILKLKIEHVNFLLTEKNNSPQEALTVIGQVDVYNFNRNFKKTYGYLPSKIVRKN